MGASPRPLPLPFSQRSDWLPLCLWCGWPSPILFVLCADTPLHGPVLSVQRVILYSRSLRVQSPLVRVVCKVGDCTRGVIFLHLLLGPAYPCRAVVDKQLAFPHNSSLDYICTTAVHESTAAGSCGLELCLLAYSVGPFLLSSTDAGHRLGRFDVRFIRSVVIVMHALSRPPVSCRVRVVFSSVFFTDPKEPFCCVPQVRWIIVPPPLQTAELWGSSLPQPFLTDNAQPKNYLHASKNRTQRFENQHHGTETRLD